MLCYLTHTEEFVKEMYLKIDIHSPQQLRFSTLAERLHIDTFYWPETSQALFMNDKGFVFLNERLTPQQQWQEFCHELAHVLLHTGNQRRMPESFRVYQEAKANTFMYHAAVPTFMLDQLNLFDFEITGVYEVQKRFNVEYDFALKRLLQYISNKNSMLNRNI